MILDTWLIEVAKSLNGESSSVVNFFLVSTDVTSISSDITSLTGEIGTRIVADKSRSLNQVTMTGTRSSTQVLTATGDYLNVLGSSSAVTGGLLMSAVTLPSLLQTTAFDIQFELSTTVNRQ